MSFKDNLIKKRYPYYVPDNEMKDIEVNSFEVKNLMNDLLDEIIKMYYPYQTQKEFINKLKELRNS